MFTQTVMMHHIVNNLWLGSQDDADKLVRNNPEKITAILNVRGADAYHPPGRDQSAEHPGKAYKWIPAPDIGTISPKHVREALLWLREQTDKKERILLHCKYGISRSPAFLAAFMVEGGISPSLEEAKATISVHRPVQPATQIVEHVKPVLLISALTGLPNRQAFDEGKASPFVAIADVDLMRTFNDVYGHIVGDALLRRLAKILVSVGLDAYHHRGNRFFIRDRNQPGGSGGCPESRKKGNGTERATGVAAENYRDGRPWKSLVANRLATFGSALLVKTRGYAHSPRSRALLPPVCINNRTVPVVVVQF